MRTLAARYLRALLLAAVALGPLASFAHEARPAYLEIKETAPGQFSVLWRTPVLAGMRLPLVLQIPEDARLAATLADPFMFQEYYRDRAPDYLGKEFGPRFAHAVAKLPTGSWQGPIESGFGWHLVYVDTLVPGRVPPFEEIEGDVKKAWLSEQKATAWEKAYKDMLAKYTVLLPAPPDAQTAARIAATPRQKEIPSSSGEGAQ